MNSLSKNTMIKIFVILISIFLFTNCNQKIDNPIVIGPYLQNVGQSKMSVIWESDTTSSGIVIYGKNGNLNLWVATNGLSKIQKVVLQNLEPETEYTYQVEVNGFRTSIHTFRTSVKNESPFSFSVYGDNKNAPFNHKKITNSILSYSPLFVSNVGDIVDNGSVFKQWRKLFFDPAKNLMASVPLFVAMGNHEDKADLFYKYFDLPNKKAWFSFDIGNAHFIYLNSSENKYLAIDSEQYDWLIKDLERINKDWTFVFMHSPLVSSGGYFYDEKRVVLLKTLHPVFEKYKVDIVFSGHNHHYERSKPIGSKNGNHSVTYIIAGNGGTNLGHIGANRDFAEVVKREHGFSIIEINGLVLKLKEVSIKNKIIDELEINKEKPNLLGKKAKGKTVFFGELKTPNKKVMEGYRSIGRKLVKTKNYEEAIPLLKEAWNIDKTCGQAAGLLAYCFSKTNINKVDEYALKSIKVTPTFSYGYYSMVEKYKFQNDNVNAIKWLQKLYKVQSDNPDALVEIANIYLSEGKTDSAIVFYKKAIKVFPSDWKLHFNLGQLFETLKLNEEARYEYQKAVEWFYEENENDNYLFAMKKVKELSNESTIKR